jgi:hypothetical protein
MQKIIFYTFNMGDVEDPYLYATFPLNEFMETEKGKWIQRNCLDPSYTVNPDPTSYGFRVAVVGEVEDRLATEYYLKWHPEKF